MNTTTLPLEKQPRNMIKKKHDKETFFLVVEYVSSQVLNTNNAFTQKLFLNQENNELDYHLFKSIRNMLKNDHVLYGKLAAHVTGRNMNVDGYENDLIYEKI